MDSYVKTGRRYERGELVQTVGAHSSTAKRCHRRDTSERY